MKILHLAQDEKFIDAANFLFEQAFPGTNTYVITSETTNLKHLKGEYARIEVLPKNAHSQKLIRGYCADYDLVVLHYLDAYKAKILLNAQTNAQFMWIFWGGEGYEDKNLFFKNIYGPLTFRKFIKKPIFDALRPLYRLLRYGIDYDFLKRRAMAKITYFGCMMTEDLNVFKNNGTLPADISEVYFSYYPLEFTFKDAPEAFSNSINILVGNSATETNNHLEVFETLNKLDLGNRKIIVPLSYGKDHYQKAIKNRGFAYFGQNFMPLTDFMVLADYYKLVQSCGFAVFGHIRQQAMGNVIAMIRQGTKVFMYEANPVYHYLVRLGCHVYTIEKDLTPDNVLAFEPLTDAQKQKNKTLIELEIKSSTIIERLKSGLAS